MKYFKLELLQSALGTFEIFRLRIRSFFHPSRQHYFGRECALEERVSQGLRHLNEENAGWLKSGADGVIGATDGGSKGLNQAAHKLAQKIIGRKG
jgi:hypothetical protein